MRYENSNVKSPSNAGSLKTVASEFAKYKLDLLSVQEFIWDKICGQPVDD